MLYVVVKGEIIMSRGLNIPSLGPGESVIIMDLVAWPIDPDTGGAARKERCYHDESDHLIKLKPATKIINEYRKKRFLEIAYMAGARDTFLILKKRKQGQASYNYDSLITAAVNFYDNLQTDLTTTAIDTRCNNALAALGLDSDDI